MLYRFKSQATADVVMLEIHANHLLEIAGKEAAPLGVFTVEQMPAAIAALQTAAHQEMKQNEHSEDVQAHEDAAPGADVRRVGLHQRAAPLIAMLKRSLAEGKDVVWGV